MSHVDIRARHRCFGGQVLFCSHESSLCGGPMQFSVFLPAAEGPFPVFLWFRQSKGVNIILHSPWEC